MDCFKCHTGIDRIYPINIETVERVLGKDEPYYQKGNGTGRYYAICPVCDNPIQIIGIFKRSAEAGKKPYGKHHGTSIPRLADYDEDAYLGCPYHNPHHSSLARRPQNDRLSEKFLTLLRDQFDRIIYILEKDTEIHISEHTARSMLRAYINDRGWLYYHASLNNLPWKFGHVEKALPLFGRHIKAGGVLAAALERSCPEVELSPVGTGNWVKVGGRDKQYVDLLYYLCKHSVKVEGNTLVESITLRLYRSKDPSTAVFEKVIPIRVDFFMNLISMPDEQSHRNERWLRIASEEIEIQHH